MTLLLLLVSSFAACVIGTKIMTEKIIVLKIGGSSITNKAKEETLDPNALEWFAKLIASSVNESFLSSSSNQLGGSRTKPKFIVVHGAGSFGHHSAKRYGLKCGKSVLLDESERDDQIPNNVNLRYQMEGLSKTRHSVQKLNAAIVGELLHHGVNAVGISPGMSISSIRAHGATKLTGDKSSVDGSYEGMKQLCKSIHKSLQAGLVPVIHGDACLLYDGKRAGILGGDTLVEGIATLWCETIKSEAGNLEQSKISKVIFVTDVAGVFTSDPKVDKDSVLIRHMVVNRKNGEITITQDEPSPNKDSDSSAISLNVGGSSHEHDVTGGLKAKLGAATTIVQSGIDVIITQCGSECTEKIVAGDWKSILDLDAGTLLSPSS